MLTIENFTECRCIRQASVQAVEKSLPATNPSPLPLVASRAGWRERSCRRPERRGAKAESLRRRQSLQELRKMRLPDRRAQMRVVAVGLGALGDENIFRVRDAQNRRLHHMQRRR